MNSLLLPEVHAVLERLHALADARDEEIVNQVRSGPGWETAGAAERAAMLRDVLLPISREAGRFLYAAARSIAARRIVEFGTSFGVSTIYFAAALRDGGGGRVIGSELEPGKVAKAAEHIAEAGLAEFAEVRAGDAMETLRDAGGTIDLLFLDGWKDLYLDVLHLVSPHLREGSLVVADDVTIFPAELAGYLAHVRNPANGFVSVTLPLGDGFEYSVKIGRDAE